jgi:hypothetical protein
MNCRHPGSSKPTATDGRVPRQSDGRFGGDTQAVKPAHRPLWPCRQMCERRLILRRDSIKQPISTNVHGFTSDVTPMAPSQAVLRPWLRACRQELINDQFVKTFYVVQDTCCCTTSVYQTVRGRPSDQSPCTRPQLPSRPDRATGSSRWHQDLHEHERPVCQ